MGTVVGFESTLEPIGSLNILSSKKPPEKKNGSFANLFTCIHTLMARL